MAALEITSEMTKAAAAIAATWGLPSELSGEDHLLRFIVKRWGPQEGTKNYFTGGRTDAEKLRATVKLLAIGAKPLRILDFAAGFRRVTRHAKALLPDHEIFASDIHPAACEFMEKRLGIQSYCSSTNPDALDVGRDYDLIYVMSLFSHLPDASFGPWLAALYRLLAPGGHLLFTAHGPATLDRFPEYYGPIFEPERGFGYRSDSDQLDLDPKEYGSMIVSVRYVVDALARYAPRGTFDPSGPARGSLRRTSGL